MMGKNFSFTEGYTGYVRGFKHIISSGGTIVYRHRMVGRNSL